MAAKTEEERALFRKEAHERNQANDVVEALQIFGKVIAELRTYSGKTKAEVAEILKISRVTLRKIESGKSSGVSIGIFLRVWQDFGIFSEILHAGIARDLVNDCAANYAAKQMYPRAVKTAAMMNGEL